MYTKSGILHLGKREIEALKVLKQHTLTDLSYGDGGTFNILKGDSFPFDEKEAKKAELGLNVIDFIIKVTE